MQGVLFDNPLESEQSAPTGQRRLALADGAWLDYRPGWLSGDGALMARLIATADWRHQRRRMYERVVDVPRLIASPPRSGADASLIARLAEDLGRRYAADLSEVSLVYYRDGNDSVAPHGDKLGAAAGDAVVAIVSLGAPRRFTLRQVRGPDSFALELGHGDLLVMGGTCQRTWLHGVPKVAFAEPRVSLVFRPGRPGAL